MDDVALARAIPLANGIAMRIDGCLALQCSTIVHHRTVVIRSPAGVNLCLRGLVEIAFPVVGNIVPEDGNKVVPVGAGLLVTEPERMHGFVLDDAPIHAASGLDRDGVCTRRREICGCVHEEAHVGPAAAVLALEAHPMGVGVCLLAKHKHSDIVSQVPDRGFDHQLFLRSEGVRNLIRNMKEAIRTDVVSPKLLDLADGCPSTDERVDIDRDIQLFGGTVGILFAKECADTVILELDTAVNQTFDVCG